MTSPFDNNNPVATTLTPIEELKASPSNPRLIKDPRFQQLLASMERYPEFLWDRPVLARLDGSIFAGEMRFRAAQHLGWSHIPVRLNVYPEAKARALGLLDNLHHGDWVEDELADDLDYLRDAGLVLDHLPFSGARLEALLQEHISIKTSEYDLEQPDESDHSSQPEAESASQPIRPRVEAEDEDNNIRCPKCGYSWQ